MELVAFLNARLAEDEALRDRAAERYAAMGRLIAPEDIWLHSLTEFTARRLLREAEAKRRIVADHEPIEAHYVPDHGFDNTICYRCADSDRDGDLYAERPWPCETMRALAAVYSDHPDYDPAWT